MVADSVFNISTKPYLIKSIQRDPIDWHALFINCAATSIWWLSEWGMWMIQGTTQRLKDSLQYDELGERNVILRLMVHLYNFQTAVVGIDQIMNSFTEK